MGLWSRALSVGLISRGKWLILEGLALLLVALVLWGAVRADPAAGPVAIIFAVLGVWCVQAGIRAERESAARRAGSCAETRDASSVAGDAVARAPALIRRDLLFAAVTLAVVCVVTFLLTRLSLDNVPGVTRRPNGSCCAVAFVNENWWQALAVLAVPIWVAARTFWWAGLIALAVPTYATFYIATTTINRYTDSDWGDGLEILAYVGSVLHLIVFFAAQLWGSFAYRRRRQRRAVAAEQ